MKIIGARACATVHNKSKERIEIFAEITSRQAQSSPRETCFSSTNKKVHFTLRTVQKTRAFRTCCEKHSLAVCYAEVLKLSQSGKTK